MGEKYKTVESCGCRELIPSEFIGVTTLNLDVKDKEKYAELNNVLKAAYRVLGSNSNFLQLYDYLQGYNKNEKKVGEVSSILNTLKHHSEKIESICDFQSYEDKYWGRVRVYRRNVGVTDINSLIKIYVSVQELGDILSVFKDIVEYLMSYGTGDFRAKVTKIMRNDQICMWLCRNDFFIVEDYIKRYEDKLCTPLKFIAYRGKLGISRELYEQNSHNGLQAILINTYFKTIDLDDEIDLIDMYEKYVSAWNGKLPDGDIYVNEFRCSNAQEFIILLETLKVLIGGGIIDDNHILLSDNEKIWSILCWSNNWKELEEITNRIS
jgi:hypothetical protein